MGHFLGSCDRASWTYGEEKETVTFTVHTARVPAPHNHNHHNQCRTPYVAGSAHYSPDDGHNDARNMLR